MIQKASWGGTAVFAVTAIAAAIAPSTFKPLALGTAVVLFVAGCGVFLWAFVLVAARSRTDRMEQAQIWFLTGPPTPPRCVAACSERSPSRW